MDLSKKQIPPVAGAEAVRSSKRSKSSAEAHQSRGLPQGESPGPGQVQLQTLPLAEPPPDVFRPRSAEPPHWSSLVQAKGGEKMATPGMDAVAQGGVSGPGEPLPYLSQIQRAFGRHDLSGVVAHTDDKARGASLSLGAAAYTRGQHVAFGPAPSLHTAAHEAAHTVQQRSGLKLAGGAGQQGDAHERHADAVAEQVVRGGSAESLLDTYSDPAATPSVAPAAGVQLKKLTDAEKAEIVASFEGVYFDKIAKGRTPKQDVSLDDGSLMLIRLLTQYNPDDDSMFFTETLNSVQAEYLAAVREARNSSSSSQSSSAPTPTPTPTPPSGGGSGGQQSEAPSQEDMLARVHQILNSANPAFSKPSSGSKSAPQPSPSSSAPAPKLSRADQQAMIQFTDMLRCHIKLQFAMVDLIAGSTSTGASAGMLLADIFSFGISTVGTVPARAAMAAALMSEHAARAVTSAKLFTDLAQMSPAQLIAIGTKSMDWPIKKPYFYELAAEISAAAKSKPAQITGLVASAMLDQAVSELASVATDAFTDYIGDVVGTATDYIPGADIVGGGVKITRAGLQVKNYTEEIEKLRKAIGK